MLVSSTGKFALSKGVRRSTVCGRATCTYAGLQHIRVSLGCQKVYGALEVCRVVYGCYILIQDVCGLLGGIYRQ